MEDALEHLRQARARAEADLTVASGGAPLCRIVGRDSAGGGKYAEGRMAALAETQRRACAQGVVDAASLLALVSSLRQDWQDAADTTLDPGPSWAAYLKGGSPPSTTSARNSTPTATQPPRDRPAT